MNLSKEKQIVNELRLAGNRGVTNVKLSKIALRYGGYLGKLYKKGYSINKENMGDGVFNYTLVKEPEHEISGGLTAHDKLLNAVDELGSISGDKLKNLMVDLGLSVKYKAGTHKR